MILFGREMIMAAFRFGNTHKYHTKSVDGFGSKLEKAVYIKLLDRQRLGLIKNLKRQQRVILQEGSRDRQITWRLDFSYENVETGKLEYAEAKGYETPDYKIKLKLWRGRPLAPLEIWKGTHQNPKVVERIEC